MSWRVGSTRSTLGEGKPGTPIVSVAWYPRRDFVGAHGGRAETPFGERMPKQKATIRGSKTAKPQSTLGQNEKGVRSMPVARLTRRPTRAEMRRRDFLAELWPDASAFTWHRGRETGFTTVPRTLSMIGALIKLLTDRADASRVYFDLWLRAHDEALIEVVDEAEFALSCGYALGTRHVRTWQERVHHLQRLGFIAVRPKPSRSIGFIFLIHPHAAVMRLKEQEPERIPDWWWALFQTRIKEIGATLSANPELQHFLRTANGPLTANVGAAHPRNLIKSRAAAE